MPKEEVLKKSKLLFDNFINSDLYKNAKTVMLYFPLGNEPDTRLLFDKLFYDKKTVLLPVTLDDEITPVVINEETEFEPGSYRIFEPKIKIPYTEDAIDIVIVPGIAFDRHGSRVGFGKGCYDKFLQKIKAIKIGYCYSFQVSNEIETSEFDIGMDYLITESEMIVCE